MAWARAYGLIPAPGSTPHAIPLIGPGPGFDPDYALTTSLDDPVIIASITVVGEPPAPLLIDGSGSGGGPLGHHIPWATHAGASGWPPFCHHGASAECSRVRSRPGLRSRAQARGSALMAFFGPGRAWWPFRSH